LLTREFQRRQSRRDLAKKVLSRLRRVPNPTPAKLLADFRRWLAEEVREGGQAPRRHEAFCHCHSEATGFQRQTIHHLWLHTGPSMDSDTPTPRWPLQFRFEPPAWPGSWRLTGRFHRPSLGYDAVPCCEWVDDEIGAKIWLPARYLELVVSVDAPQGRFGTGEKANEVLPRAALSIWRRPQYGSARMSLAMRLWARALSTVDGNW
jgi:hypothetical protein